MPHVTTFTFQAQPGKADAVVEHFARWERERMSGATGFQFSLIVANNENPEQFTAIVQFDTTANYQKNSDRPEISTWFQGLRASLIADPVWFNGTVVRETRP